VRKILGNYSGSTATLASLGGTSSRRGSGDTSISADTEASIREIKDSLAEVEEKYKKAMVSNAQLDNEKTNFMYQVDTLKDALLELEEQLAESRRQYEEKSKEFEREKHAHSILQFQFMEMKEALKQREEMLAKHGIIPDSEVATNGETSDILNSEGHLDSSKAVQGTNQALKTSGDGTLGKANGVDMKNEILEDVGKREILQNTEQEEHKEESEEQEIKTLHAEENAKAEQIIEENAAMSTAMLTNSRRTEQIQSHPEQTSGNVSSNDESDADDLRKEGESTGSHIEAQQPVGEEAEHSDLNPRKNEEPEVGALSGQGFETPQEVPSDLGEECELEKAAAEQKGGDLEAGNAGAGNEADVRSSSSELVSDQSELPEVAAVGSLSQEPSVENQTKGFQHLEENTDEKVRKALEECTDGRTDGSTMAKEENEMGGTAQGQAKKTESKGMEGKELCESGASAAVSEGENEDQAQIGPISSEDGPIVSLDEGKMQGKTEHEQAVSEKDGQEEVLMNKLEVCSGFEGIFKQEGSSVDPSPSDGDSEEGEAEIQDESRKRKENKTERVDDLKPSVEIETALSVEESTCGVVGEKSISLEAEDHNIVKQEESECRQESTEGLCVTTGNKVEDEALKETNKQLKLADGGFASEQDADVSLQETTKPLQHFIQGSSEAKDQTPDLENVHECTEREQDNQKVQGSEEDKNQGIEEQGEAKEALAEAKVETLPQRTELDENVKLESQAEEGVENDSDDFEESKQILETDEKCGREKADTQQGGGAGAHGVIEEVASCGETGECQDNVDVENTLTEDDSLQQKEEGETEETRPLEGKGSSPKADEKADALEVSSEASDSNDLEKTADKNVSQQDLEGGGNDRDEGKEDSPGGRKGKGKSKDDCIIS
uniref:LRR binding FLII interacting protein 1 n=1 Tax=Nothoprocta perdicaria TaxID=30464 RepID=A0A8C6ZB27_NOTPE